MPVHRPPMLRLGGEEAFANYQREFDRLYRSGPVKDVFGRLVVFPPDACEHVCFKDQREDRYRRAPRVWTPERAERIPWILAALTAPEEVRPSHQTDGHQAFLLLVEGDPAAGTAWERFGVYAEPIAAGRAAFVTAFPMDRWYWDAARLKGPRLYPPPKPKRRR
jgi:hypothetical protein